MFYNKYNKYVFIRVQSDSLSQLPLCCVLCYFHNEFKESICNITYLKNVTQVIKNMSRDLNQNFFLDFVFYIHDLSLVLSFI